MIHRHAHDVLGNDAHLLADSLQHEYSEDIGASLSDRVVSRLYSALTIFGVVTLV